MARYRRHSVAGGTNFFKETLANRRSTLLKTRVDLLRAAFRTVRDRHPFTIDDFIHYNVVKHGYVANPQDWPNFSLYRFIRKGIVPPNWGKAVDDAGSCEFGEPMVL